MAFPPADQLRTPAFSGTARALYELTKPRITALVLASTAVGYVVGAGAAFDLWVLAHVLFGTALIAGGTAAHNQFLERNLDKLMVRTAKRPLPMDRIEPITAQIWSLSLITAGLLWLILTVNPVAGLVSLATSAIYLLAYTPLKRISFWNVPVGSVAGALPPVGGWAAATGTITDPGMWYLFGIVFFWQIPHVIAIAWMLKDDYARAGFRMLPRNDESGLKTAWFSLANLVALFPMGVGLLLEGYAGVWTLLGLTAAAGVFLASGIGFLLKRDRDTGRRLLFGSLAYLPIVWIVLALDVLMR